MQPARQVLAKKNLLLCFDAFGTLFTPKEPIPSVYARAAVQHGLSRVNAEDTKTVGANFKKAFRHESKVNPNYGKATGLGAPKWWGNIIRNTFKSFVDNEQEVPQALVDDLLHRFSSKDGYMLYPDVLPFFSMLQSIKFQPGHDPSWQYDKTIVGVITNSDDRVPGILTSFGLNISPRRVGKTDERKADATLEDDISFVVLSYDVGVEKPDRQIFNAASKMLAEILRARESSLTVDSFEKVYVGDDYEKDHVGALNAGWEAVLLDRPQGADEGQTVEEGQIRLGNTTEFDTNGHSQKVSTANDLRALKYWRPNQ